MKTNKLKINKPMIITVSVITVICITAASLLYCYSPPMLSTNRHRILSIRHWLCQPIDTLFCQENEMLSRKTKAINPITKPLTKTDSGIIRI